MGTEDVALNSPSRNTATHWGNFRVGASADGSIKVESNEGDASPSAIGRSLVNVQDPNSRIAQPMIRQGYYRDRHRSDGRGRGREPFVPVEWDEAFDIAAAALLDARTLGGNEAIYGGSYGWASAGRFHHAQSQIHRFLRCFGGYTDSVNSYSSAAAEVIVPHVLGLDFYSLAMQAPTSQELADHTKLVVLFGGAPLKNTQVNPGGVGNHNAANHLHAARAAGVDFVNVSPLRDDVGDFLDADWWPCRPNADVAIMLGLMHTLLAEGLHNAEFLSRYCVGFERFAAYLTGDQDGCPKTAEWAGSLSDIAPDRIRALARRMAAQRCLIGVSLSIQRAEHGEQPYWAAITLAAMLGHIGLPGGGISFASGVGKLNVLQRKTLNFSVGSLPQGTNKIRTYIPVARITDILERPLGRCSYNGKELTYPHLRLIYWAGGNVFHHHQDINRLRAAWSRPDTIITNEIYWTSAARHADIVFPTTSPLEREDFAGGSNDNWLAPMRRVLEPFGQSCDDYAIFSGLAERLGIAAAFTEGRDASGWVRALYERTVVNANAVGVTLPPFDTFMAGDPIDLSGELPEATYALDQFRADPEAFPLKTPSGRIEIFSETIAGYRYSDCIGHAAWFDKVEWLGAPLARRYPLHLLSNQPATRLHSQLDHGVTSRDSKVKGREPVRLHQWDAQARGISDGDIVRIFNDRGATLAGAILSDALRPGVIQLATGAWYDVLNSDDPRSLEIHGNPNAVTRDVGTSRLAQGSAANSCLVEVEKWVGTPPPIRAFHAPRIVAGERGDP